MNVFVHTPSLRASRVVRALLSLPLLFLAPLAFGQEVLVSTGGIVSVTGQPIIYNDKYVIQKTDFGFLWLDTAALVAGLVQVEAKCGVGQPASQTGIYVIGDCNGITNVSSSGNVVLARQFSGQCAAAKNGCNGDRTDGTGMFKFVLGTWEYLGKTDVDIADSTQTADPQGRTWRVQVNSLSSFTFIASGNPLTPPTAAAAARNVSAANRVDKTNYYGDQWELKDASTTVSPITNVDWDLLYNGTFAKDEGGAPPGESTITGFFPCDPKGTISGDFHFGTNCVQSLGFPTSIPSNGTYKFAMQSANANGTSANVFVSSPIAVTCPQPNIVGYTNFVGTCAKTQGTLNVLIGGNADANGSNGNPISFDWSFTGQNPISVSGASVPVPSGATGFTLTITYPGGYQATASGSVVQASLVAAFSIAPNPVLINTTMTLTNQMQKAAATTLDSVDYLINPSACGPAPPIAANPLPASFLSGTLTAPVTAPGTKGDFCVYLKYNFTPSGGGPQSQIVSNAVTTTDWVANPLIQINPLPLCGSTLCPQVGTTYSLADGESIPLSPHPGATWDLNGTAIGSSADANTPINWTPAAVCSSCTLGVTVNGTRATLPVNVSGAVPTPNPTPVPTPTPGGGGGGISVSISGPSSGSKGVPLTYTANPAGGNGSYSYSWQCDYNPLAGFTPQGQTMTCTWAASGPHNVKVLVRDSAGGSALSPDYTVTIAGLPAPAASATLDGNGVTRNILNGRWSAPTGTSITFTASETNASSWSWNFGDGTTASGKTVTHSFSTSGPYAISLTVAGDEANTSGTASTNINLDITGPPAPSTAYTVTGATPTGSNAYTAEAGRNINFTANATQASGFSWDFGDETKSGRTVTKNYATTGSKTVKLTVTGDGVNTVGTASVSITMGISPPTFRAVIVPGVARLDDGITTWGTDVSITNAGSNPMNLGGAFVPFVADDQASASLDLTQLSYAGPVPLPAGGSISIRDIVGTLNEGKAGKGTFVLKYTGGTHAPLVTARVYFQPKVNPGNISYGSGLPAYEVDGAGGIAPQGYVSTALSQAPTGAQIESGEALLDVTISVSLAGAGSGTVTSSPPGISCPTTCSASFPVGTYVQLSGTPAPGSTFVGITGCDLYALGICTVNSSKTVTAQFDGAPPPGPGNVSLSVSKSGTGTGTVSSSPSGISCGAACSASFTQGSSVTLTAAPDSGSSFSGWGGSCSGTGSCVVTLAANASVTATFTAVAPPPAVPQGDQYLIGLRSDPRSRFVVTLFNASGAMGDFQLEAFDDQGSNVQIFDGTGNRVKFRKFTGLRPYQQIYLRDSDLGLDDSKFYVLKATRTSANGTLLAFGTALDKKTNDLVQIADDSQASTADENGSVSYWIAGVSHLDRDYGARWRTDLRVFNRGSKRRNLDFEYSYILDGVTHVAHVYNVPIASGGLLTYDDVVSNLMTGDKSVDLSGNSGGILKISYPEDDESGTKPLVIGSRNYDDQPTGTAGSQLAVYTSAQTGSAGRDLSLTGVEDSDRYRSVVGVFAIDPGPVNFRIAIVDPDGNEVGSFAAQVGGTGARWGQLDLAAAALNFINPGKPVSIRFEQVSGGRLGAYAFTVDKVTLDTNFIQAVPQN